MLAFIFDVDGTVADLRHRLHHIRNGNYDHQAFEAGVQDDLPIWPVIKIVRALDKTGFHMLATSGRAERLRTVTEEWFRCFGVPFERLYMRANDDRRADHIVKRQILQGIRADGYEVEGVIDDRQSVVDMWREEGLTCLQCSPTMTAPFESVDGNVPYMTIMVGPSGAGKTTWLTSEDARINFGMHAQQIISSDQVRLDLLGGIRMDKNDDVFEAIRNIATVRLRHGLPVTIDATNIRTKDRVMMVELAGGICPVRYVVVDRPLAEKIATGGWRLNVTFADGQTLIERHDQTFRSNIKAIMSGDELPNVRVFDKRILDPSRQAAA